MEERGDAEGEDPNKDKFLPHCVHLIRPQFKTVSEILGYLRLSQSYPPAEHQLTYIIDDNKFESCQNGIIDLGFGLGCEFINIQGINKTEKLAKVIRFAEIIESL